MKGCNHNTSRKDYENLAQKLGYPGSERLIKILDYLLTGEQAAIANALPGTPEEVAAKTGLDVNFVKDNLDEMFFKGAAFPRGDFQNREYYRFARSANQLHDTTLATIQLDPIKDKRFFELWHYFCLNEMYPRFAQKKEEDPRPTLRILPANNAIKDLPDVQPWENFLEILKSHEFIAVVPCSCRWRTTAVTESCEHTDETEQWKCLQLGRSAEYVLARNSGKRVSLEEAIEITNRAEKEGLIKIWSYNRNMNYPTACHCCSDCCVIFVPASKHNVDYNKVYGKSRFAACVDEDICDGCQNCLERCFFEAIDLVRSGKKYKAAVDPEKCFGCGVCVLNCNTGALKMKTVRDHSYIPE